MKVLHYVSFALIVVGAVNWGLVGAFQFDLVKYLCVDLLAMENLANVVYVLVGVAGVWAIVDAFMCGGCCSASDSGKGGKCGCC